MPRRRSTRLRRLASMVGLRIWGVLAGCRDLSCHTEKGGPQRGGPLPPERLVETVLRGAPEREAGLPLLASGLGQADPPRAAIFRVGPDLDQAVACERTEIVAEGRPVER